MYVVKMYLPSIFTYTRKQEEVDGFVLDINFLKTI